MCQATLSHCKSCSWIFKINYTCEFSSSSQQTVAPQACPTRLLRKHEWGGEVCGRCKGSDGIEFSNVESEELRKGGRGPYGEEGDEWDCDWGMEREEGCREDRDEVDEDCGDNERTELEDEDTDQSSLNEEEEEKHHTPPKPKKRKPSTSSPFPETSQGPRGCTCCLGISLRHGKKLRCIDSTASIVNAKHSPKFAQLPVIPSAPLKMRRNDRLKGVQKQRRLVYRKWRWGNIVGEKWVGV